MRPIQRSFSAGEISPALRQHADLAMYQKGLAACENMIVRAEGGVASRPGTSYVGPLKTHAKRGRLIPFSFNTEQTYMLVFEHLLMRVIIDGAFVIDSASPPDLYELVTPYTEADLPYLIFTQDADVMTITRHGHDPAYLTRIAHDDWSLTDVDFSSSVDAPGALTMTTVGTGGGANNRTYRYVVTAIDDRGVESLPSPEGSSGSVNSLTTTFGNKLNWADVTGAAYYRIYKDPSDGSGVYGWIGDSVVSEFVDYNIAPVTSDAPPSDYLPFTGASDKPATVGYYQQRTIYANSVNEPLTVWATQSGIYDSMRSSAPPRDNDALEFTVKARRVNEIRHILDLDALILLTSGNETWVTDGVDMVLTPTTLGSRARSYFGASWCAPALTGNTAIYVVEKGARIRDIRGEGIGMDLSITARHFFDKEAAGANYVIEEMAYAAEPYGIVWMVRDDGLLLGLTYQPEHEVFAWHQHTTGVQDKFESVASISENGRDSVYLIVRRYSELDETWYRVVERMEPRITDSAENAYCVDCGLTYTGAPATIISGLDHLEGAEVAVLADGNEVQGLVVNDGEIELPNASSVVHVGLPYVPAVQTLDLDFGSEDTINARNKSVSSVTINVLKSRGGWVAPVLDNGVGEFQEFPPRFESDGYDTIALFTGKREVTMGLGWNKSGAIRIEQRSPLPLEILSIVPETDVS